MNNDYNLTKEEQSKYSEAYSDSGFLAKTRNNFSGMSMDLLRKGYQLYFLIKSDKVPIWAKATAVAALGYLIAPIDFIPDVIPVLGFSDDAGVVAAAYLSLMCYVDPEIETQADEALSKLLK